MRLRLRVCVCVCVCAGTMQGKSLLPTFEERNDSKGQQARRDYGTELSDNPSNTRVGVTFPSILWRPLAPFPVPPTVPHLSNPCRPWKLRSSSSLLFAERRHQEVRRACTVLTTPSHSRNFAQATEDSDDFPPARHHTVQVCLKCPQHHHRPPTRLPLRIAHVSRRRKHTTQTGSVVCVRIPAAGHTPELEIGKVARFPGHDARHERRVGWNPAPASQDCPDGRVGRHAPLSSVDSRSPRMRRHLLCQLLHARIWQPAKGNPPVKSGLCAAHRS